MRVSILAVVAAVAVPVLATDVLARDIEVPREFARLQDALDAARPGDRVLILKRRVRGYYEVATDGVEVVGQERGTRLVAPGARRGQRAALSVQGDGVTVRGIDFVRGGLDASGDGLVVEDCTFSRVGPGVRGAALLVFSDSATVRDVDVDLSGDRRSDPFGIYITGDGTVVENCNVVADSGAQPLHLEGDDARVEGCSFSRPSGEIAGLVLGDDAIVRGNLVEGSAFSVLSDGSLVDGNTFRDCDFGSPALFLRGDGNEVLGNSVLRAADSGIVVYGDANLLRDNTVTDAGSDVRGVGLGNGFVVRGTANLLEGNVATRARGEGFRITGNTDIEANGNGIFLPGAGATALGPGNCLVSCTGVGSGRCGLGNWTLGTAVTDSTFSGNGADVVDTGGFDTFTGNTWGTGGPGWAGDGSGVMAPDWGDTTFDPSQQAWD